MQNLHMQRKRNCRQFSAPADPQRNCTQKVQRVRCCGQVLNEQENGNELLEKGQGCGQGMANRQGRGQGRGRGQGNNQGRGQGRGQGQGNNQGRCQGREQSLANGQGRRQGCRQGMINNQA